MFLTNLISFYFKMFQENFSNLNTNKIKNKQTNNNNKITKPVPALSLFSLISARDAASNFSLLKEQKDIITIDYNFLF